MIAHYEGNTTESDYIWLHSNAAASLMMSGRDGLVLKVMEYRSESRQFKNNNNQVATVIRVGSLKLHLLKKVSTVIHESHTGVSLVFQSHDTLYEGVC